MPRRAIEFETIRSEGGLLPPDLLRRILDPKEKLDGTLPEDYGLPKGERLNEVITQSWSRLRKHWAEFRASATNLPAGEAGTGLTNDKWSLPLLRELGFGLLPTSAGPELGGRVYAINRFFGPVPIHLIGCGVNLDRRAAGVRGAAAANPHGLVQEFLNRSAAHMWGIVSNGLQFRILRDNQALSRQSFLEFDLDAMLAGELYADFVLLWLVAHATRFVPHETDRPDTCWLEDWTKVANEQGTRALLELRGGVEKALQILGEGFTAHPKNSALRDSLRTGQTPLADFHAQLLRIVYRCIFLFVAEDRKIDGQSLLHPRADSETARIARERYAANYSTARLRELASSIKGSRHGDLWKQFQLISAALFGDTKFAAARESLALPALGSFLWDPASTAALNETELTNHDFLEALRHLAYTRPDKMLRPVDFKNLGAEELGGVYESLLALTPQVSSDGARFTFAEFAGNERKKSGSYYTPDSLVQCLLDSGLDPVVEEALKGKTGSEAEKAILALKVCDPAVGSGHFLVGAAHRLARHLARVRAVAHGESEPSPLLYQNALRDVIGHCLYGVDISPMAAELCRVSLWLEALEPGKPLSFLEHRIQVGNSLLGTTPGLMAKGIPDEAFIPKEGDDKEICKEFKRINKEERNHQTRLFTATTEPWQQLGNLANSLAKLDMVGDDSLEGIREKQRLYEKAIRSADYLSGRFLADTWCAAFVWKKTAEFKYPITEEVFRRIEHNPQAVDPWMREEIQRLAVLYQFFHWHLAFPDVFHIPLKTSAHENEQAAGWDGGFDCVLGNPPWEKVEVLEREWFGTIKLVTHTAPAGDEKGATLRQLRDSDPLLYEAFLAATTIADGERSFIQHTGRYPLCGQGRINSYAAFAETNLLILGPSGIVGCVLPPGIATDDSTKFFIQHLVENESLRCFYAFTNRGYIFRDIESTLSFALITYGRAKFTELKIAAQLWQIEHLADEGRVYTLDTQTIRRINPNTLNLPILQSSLDAVLVSDIHRRIPVLQRDQVGGDEAWRVDFRQGLFNMTTDKKQFRSFEDLLRQGCKLNGYVFSQGTARFLPLYEAKFTAQFNHRHGTFDNVPAAQRFGTRAQTNKPNYEDLQDPEWKVIPRYWIAEEAVRGATPSHWKFEWFLGFRNAISVVADSRSVAFSVIPRVGVGNSMPLLFVQEEAYKSALLLANFNSFVLDYVGRQKAAGGNLNFYVVKQLPILGKAAFGEPCLWSGNDLSLRDWFLPRVLELAYSAWDLEPFAADCGYSGPPFIWDEERRFQLRCELDAAFFHLYLPPGMSRDWPHPIGESAENLASLQASFPTPPDAVAFIMDSFPIVKRRDEENFDGDYRTKRVILEIYDAMAESIRTGTSYKTGLAPPPADPSCRHPKKEIGVLAFGSLIHDPGPELEDKIVMRIKTQTPFSVEYGRYSGKTRGGAPTLVPHQNGSPVAAEILVLEDEVTVQDATNMLWRRETRKTGTGETYTEGAGPNSVLVRQWNDDPCVETVLYTDFTEAGKIPTPTATELAERAARSVEAAEPGKDGITYLIDAIKNGIQTPLTPAYRSEILEQLNAGSLEEALRKAKDAAVARGKELARE